MVRWADRSPQPKNGISISQAVFVRLTVMSSRQTHTDRHTHRPRDIGNNRPHLSLHSVHAMRPSDPCTLNHSSISCFVGCFDIIIFSSRSDASRSELLTNASSLSVVGRHSKQRSAAAQRHIQNCRVARSLRKLRRSVLWTASVQ